MRIGTRPSAMALAQARHVAALLPGECDIVPIASQGDRRREVSDKADWITNLESALQDGQVDLLVHAAKDVPSNLADGCVLAAVPVRDTPWDALCGSAPLENLPAGARIGTSSARRRAWLQSERPDVLVEDVRGNVDSRLKRVAPGDLDAIVVSLAGLERLGRRDACTQVLSAMPPAPAQGALIVEARADDMARLTVARTIAHSGSEAQVLCERELVRRLGADCRSAVGAHASLQTDGTLLLAAEVFGRRSSVRCSGTGVDPVLLGAEVADGLLTQGAARYLF